MGCQRDDICPESTDTTPFLILRFYEDVDPFDPQAPQNLSIKDPEREGYVTVRSGQDQTIEYFKYSKDSLAIPLKTSADITTFEFTVNTGNIPEDDGDSFTPDQMENTDIITFIYGRQEEYLNRACAYKMNYTALKVEHDGGNDGNWIKDIEVEQVNIEDQKNAHVSIFF
jgi:hypothetical protein